MMLQFDSLYDDRELSYGLVFEDAVTWIPKSQVEMIDLEDNVIEVKDWLALKQGLEVYEV